MKKALIQMHAAVLLWGFTGVLGRAISLDAPILVIYRMLLTFILVGIILAISKQLVVLPKRQIKQLAFIGSIIAVHWVTFYLSIQMANASIALVCLSTASVFTALLDPIMNKGKINIKEVLLGIMALVGVYCIYQFQQTFVWGILWGVIAALLSTVFTILNKRMTAQLPSKTILFYEMGSGFLFLSLLLPLYVFTQTEAVVLLPRTASLATWHQNDWLWLIILAFFCTVLAQDLALKALKQLSAFTTTLSVNLEPIYGIILAIYFFKENTELNSGFYLGMGLIFSSVIIQMLDVLWQKKKQKKIKKVVV